MLTTILIGAFCFACLGGAILFSIKLSHLDAAKQQPVLPPHETDELKQWKQIFRETVLSAEGSISPEMEAFLSSEEERVTETLAKARLVAEEERTKILKKAEEERAEILGEEGEWCVNDRPLLVGAARKEYDDDAKAAETNIERGKVIRRWHNKGFRFPKALRASVLQKSTDENSRDACRQLFDEQDEPSTPSVAKKKRKTS